MLVSVLLTNMVVLTSGWGIPTNTPALQEYARNTFFAQAQSIAAKWHLDAASIATNKITYFRVTPYPSGISGSLTLDNRYNFGFNLGSLTGFSDSSYDSTFLVSDDKRMIKATVKKWLSGTNLLSLAEARKVAEAAVDAANLRSATGEGTHLEAYQEKYFSKTEVVPLPYYVFDWVSNNTNLIEYVAVEVSGLTGRVAELETRLFQDRPAITPANYLELLGLPTNTVFVRRKFSESTNGVQQYEIYNPKP
jgi:hypothetical protein